MLVQLHFVPLAGFAALMAIAALEDFRRFVIPNTVVVGLCALWVLYLLTAPNVTVAGGFAAAGCGLAVLFAGALLFSRGLIGGGDVKLLAAAALWAGPTATLSLLILTGLLGGLLTLFLLSPVGAYLTAAGRGASISTDVAVVDADPMAVPYGIAIAAAAVTVTIPPGIGW
jgi:prepilin peptidase CpaA